MAIMGILRDVVFIARCFRFESLQRVFHLGLDQVVNTLTSGDRGQGFDLHLLQGRRFIPNLQSLSDPWTIHFHDNHAWSADTSRNRLEIKALGNQLGKKNIASWASKEDEDKDVSSSRKDERTYKSASEMCATAWEHAEKAKYMARIGRRPDITEGLTKLKCRTLISVSDSSPFYSEALYMILKLDRRCNGLVEKGAAFEEDGSDEDLDFDDDEDFKVIYKKYMLHYNVDGWHSILFTNYASVWHNWFDIGTGFWLCNRTFKLDIDDENSPKLPSWIWKGMKWMANNPKGKSGAAALMYKFDMI
nr:remorin family protein [Tanacetum cinerariifolium]